MGVFDKLLGRLGVQRGAPPAAETTPQPAVVEDPNVATAADGTLAALDRIDHFGDARGPDETEALALLRALRSTPREGAAITSLASRMDHLPDELATAAAKAALDRGEPALAKRFLARVRTPAALLLSADLAEDEGDAPRALALVERVLARSIDHPGARERHTRLSIALGRRAPAPVTPSADGTVLSAQVKTPYVLRREIARGGAAAVYEAEDRELLRRIALKVYHDAAGGRDQLVHEARVATELGQPGVVRVFDVDVTGGWLVLEYFERGSLREWLRERPEEAARFEWLESLARTLDDVSARGYVHLDVKPANVLLRSAHEAVLSDFGSARRRGAPCPPGSLSYVSPERLAGASASPLDDVYGFGRIVEDVLAVGGELVRTDLRESLARLARACTGPASERPTALGPRIATLARER